MADSYAEAAVDADRAVTRAMALRQDAVNKAYGERTGRTVPESVPFFDEAGNQYEIQVHVTLRLVARATGEHADDK